MVSLKQGLLTEKAFPVKGRLFVGAARLERATACTPCKYASQLHHAPIVRGKDTIVFLIWKI